MKPDDKITDMLNVKSVKTISESIKTDQNEMRSVRSEKDRIIEMIDFEIDNLKKDFSRWQNTSYSSDGTHPMTEINIIKRLRDRIQNEI